MPRSLALRAVLLLAWVTLAACKTPRPPLEVPEGDISGDWIAYSAATGSPQETGEMRWWLLLEQQEAGKLRGRGALAHPGGTTAFSINGIRGQRVLNFGLRLEDGTRGRYEGSMLDLRTLVGQMQLRDDTLSVVFTRDVPPPP